MRAGQLNRKQIRPGPAEKNDLIVALVRELTGNPHLTSADVTIRNGKVRMIETN